MTGKERMLAAILREKPDRLPVTVHQWQPYHLREYMGGVDQLEAYLACGLDVSFNLWDAWKMRKTGDWVVKADSLGEKQGELYTRYTANTPDGDLTWVKAQNPQTTYHSEFPVKDERDLEIFLKYYPGTTVDRDEIKRAYERTGDHGITRGLFSMYAQAGPWQDFCEIVGTEEAIYWAMDEPDQVHHALDVITTQKVQHIEREMQNLPLDLIECGGGAASSTVISPSMFKEFCIPYDRRINEALHASGYKAVYHTCGGMMALLDLIPENLTDASETLSPPGVGGDIKPEDRALVKAKLGSKVGLIGGIDQSNLLEQGTAEEIRAEVEHCFETFGAGGGYICSGCDHFFNAPVENLKALADAAKGCTY